MKQNGWSDGQRVSISDTVFVADFETTTDPEDCRVWLWCKGAVGADKQDYELGTDIESFVSSVELSRVCYFHNLAFDGSFILDYIMREGYVHTSEKPRAGEFTTLISNMGKFYSITVCWESGATTEFRDSLKLIPMPVSAMSKAYHVEATKGEIDYTAPRPVGYEPTDDEIEYVLNDVYIVAHALQVTLAAGMNKLTVGANALAEYKDIKTSKWFKRTFPVLAPGIDADVRRAYRGGWTYADPRFKGQFVGPGRVFDVNSLYPSVMYDRTLPWGVPQFCDTLPSVSDEWPLFITGITFTARLKPGHLPCIQIKSSPFFVESEYQTVIDEPVSLSCTNIDLALWQEHYDMDVLAYDGAWQFHGAQGLFTDYIDKWMAVKANSTGGMRQIAKLQLNSLYGKFATNPDVTGKYPVMKDDVVRLVMGPEETRDPVYTPMGAFITAYAREVTIRAAQQHYDIFAYADTDSLHLLCDETPPDLDVDPARLGAWKEELVFERAVFLRAKAYSERDYDGEYHTHVAGLPTPVAEAMTFDDMVSGKTFAGKFVPERVRGGIVLRDVGFTLKVDQ